jgi:cell division protein FtsB
MRYSKIVSFIAIQLFMLFAYINQQSRLVNISYQKQEKEKELALLTKTKQELLHQLHLLASNKSAIKEYATSVLGMQKVAINQIRKLTDHE